MDFKTTSARSSFYGAASYVERDVRSDLKSRSELKWGYHGRISYPGDWKIDAETKTLQFAFRGVFNRRTTKMPGAYEEYHNDIDMDVANVPFDRLEELKPQLIASGIKITPHIESIIEQSIGFRDGKVDHQDLGYDPVERAERVQARLEKAIHEATNLQQPMKVGGALHLKR